MPPVPLLLYYIPAGREQLPFPGKVAEAEAGCEEMRMPAGSEISLPACLTISPKRMQVRRAGVDQKKKKIFFFPEEPASKHFRLSWPYGLCCDCSALLLECGSSPRPYVNGAWLCSNKTLFMDPGI